MGRKHKKLQQKQNHNRNPPKYSLSGWERFLDVSILTAAGFFLLSTDRLMATLTYSIIIILLIAAVVAIVWFFLNY